MVANYKNKAIFKAAGIAFLVVIGMLMLADFRMYQKKRELVLQVENYKKRIEDVKESNKKLKNEIENSDNTDYLEKIAYEQLGQQRPGEKQIIFIEPEKKVEDKVQNNASWTGWLSGFMDWIKSKF
jgi:cell division protein FtsB